MESRPLIAELRGQDTLLFHDLEHCIEGASLALPGIHYLPDGAATMALTPSTPRRSIEDTMLP